MKEETVQSEDGLSAKQKGKVRSCMRVRDENKKRELDMKRSFLKKSIWAMNKLQVNSVRHKKTEQKLAQLLCVENTWVYKNDYFT